VQQPVAEDTWTPQSLASNNWSEEAIGSDTWVPQSVQSSNWQRAA
jgi:hypothetical protein